jgi:hypothetical protein
VPDVHRLNITAKIWLSVGVFILGNVLSTGLSQIQGGLAVHGQGLRRLPASGDKCAQGTGVSP